MAWVWHDRLDTDFDPAEFDYSSPVTISDALTVTPIDPNRGRPIFRITSSIKNFESLHCPPVGAPPAVDGEWQRIILQFVPKHLVQFYPITLIAPDGVTKKFSWVLPFSQVRCIDSERSDVVSKVERPGKTHVISCNYYVHHEHCLRGHHLARDEQQLNHLVISDELREAFAATAESSMFFRPEDVPTFIQRTVN